MQHTERRILRIFIGWVLVLGSGVIFAAFLYGGNTIEDSYILGVLNRSINSVFQGTLLAAACAVPFHAIWIRIHYGIEGLVAYEAFAQWAQTLFTSIGFMGTIIGVSLAVAGLEEAMIDGDPGALIGGLSTAFDTTFLGLFGAVCLMVLRRLSRILSPMAP